MRKVLFSALFFHLLFAGHLHAADKPAGDVIIFHAGSLSVPLEALEKKFESMYPGVDILREASGSQKAARKIIDLRRPCDIMASADYWVIDKLLVPQYADWNIRFASNRMVLCHTRNSRSAKAINAGNWHAILLDKKIQWGHSDPDLDPCGYRAMMVMQLAERHYNIPGLYKKLTDSLRRENIRPKSVELISLLQTGNLDYAWEYVSVARQHKLEYVDLPSEINLGDSALDDLYGSASVLVAGETPGEKMEVRGQSCVYGITLLKNAPNRKAALLFLEFLADPQQGLRILEETGQPALSPCRVADEKMKEKIPAGLRRFVVSQK